MCALGSLTDAEHERSVRHLKAQSTVNDATQVRRVTCAGRKQRACCMATLYERHRGNIQKTFHWNCRMPAAEQENVNELNMCRSMMLKAAVVLATIAGALAQPPLHIPTTSINSVHDDTVGSMGGRELRGTSRTLFSNAGDTINTSRATNNKSMTKATNIDASEQSNIRTVDKANKAVHTNTAETTNINNGEKSYVRKYNSGTQVAGDNFDLDLSM
jgi:hypothetical protein